MQSFNNRAQSKGSFIKCFIKFDGQYITKVSRYIKF
jgi:hypothetical protein